MYPGMMHWWRLRHHGHGCGTHAEHDAYTDEAFGRGGHGRHERRERRHDARMAAHHDHDLGAGAFGVRRPLRFLAHKLDLDERQVGELARILEFIGPDRELLPLAGTVLDESEERSMRGHLDLWSGRFVAARGRLRQQRGRGGHHRHVARRRHPRD